MRKLAIFIVVAFLLVLCAAPVYAQPKLPHAFYGSVLINGSPASDGAQVSATVNIGDIISTQNPVTTVGGSYGIDSSYLLVQGYDIPDGATITFYVKGVEAEGQTDTFEAGGGPDRRDLSVTMVAPPVEVGPLAPPAPRIETTLFGIEGLFRISETGEILKTITATSADGMLTITIPKGTIALDKDGNPLSSLTVDIDPSPPDPPEDANIIGLAYDFGPDGATFAPPITFTWSYDPDALPEDVSEEDLVLAYYDEEAGEWVELPCVVDPVTNTITASVSHFTTFAIIAPAAPAPPPPAPAAFTVSTLTIRPAEVQPKEVVTILAKVANTGGMEGSYTVVLLINGVKEAEKSITVAAGESQLVSFTVAKEKAGSYSITVDGLSGSFMVVAPPPVPPPPPPPTVPPEVKPPINWPLIGGIIAAVVVVGLLIFFLVVRRRAY